MSPSSRRAGATAALFLIAATGPGGLFVAAAPSLNINDPNSLSQATKQALTNLMTYYTPNSGGVFNQVQTPWHESGMIWGTFMDYAKWSGDTSFMGTVVNALANASYNGQQDFLGGAMVTQVETLLGRWNDDILWPCQAIVAGAEIYGPTNTMPGANGPWMTAATKTIDQTWAQWDQNCSGGIYWSRDRSSKNANYKSLITQLEFISSGARSYIQTKNETYLDLANQALDWVVGPSGLGNQGDGTLFDGMDITACDQPTLSQWSYNYGEMLGGLAWMHKATGNSSYLNLAKPFLSQAMNTFAGQNTSGIVTEQCEPSGNCNRDQQGFKAILLRNMAYLYRETSDSSVKSAIQDAIDTSLNAMVSSSCDNSWNCNGNWSTSAPPIKYVRSQHVSSALLVAAMGVHNTGTGTGLLTNVNGTAVSADAGSGGNQGSVESRPLNAATGAQVKVASLVAALALGFAVVLA